MPTSKELFGTGTSSTTPTQAPPGRALTSTERFGPLPAGRPVEPITAPVTPEEPDENTWGERLWGALAPRTRTTLGGAIDTSGGVLSYLGDFRHGLAADVREIIHGGGALWGSAQIFTNASVRGLWHKYSGFGRIHSGIRSREDLEKTPTQFVGSSAGARSQEYLENIPTQFKELVAGIAESELSRLREFNEDPWGFIQKHPVSTVLDIAGVASLAAGGVGKIAGVSRKARGASSVSGGLRGAREVSLVESLANKTARGLNVFSLAEMGGAGVVRAVRKMSPRADVAAARYKMERTTDRLILEQRSLERVFSTTASKEAVRGFGHLPPEDMLAFFPLVNGSVVPLHASDELLNAVKLYQSNVVPDEMAQRLLVDLKLSTPKEILERPWLDYEAATGMSRDEILNTMGITSDEIVAKRWRERNWPVPTHEFPGVRREPISVKSPKPVRMKEVTERVPGEQTILLGTRAPEVEPVHMVEVMERAPGYASEVRWGTRRADRPFSEMPEIIPPPVVMIDPTYVPIIMKVQAQKLGPLGATHAVQRARSGAEVAAKGPLDETARMMEGIGEADIAAREAAAAALLERKAKSLRQVTPTVAAGDIGPAGTMRDPSLIQPATGVGAKSPLRELDPVKIAQHHLSEVGRLVSTLAFHNSITENLAYKLHPLERGGVRLRASGGHPGMDRYFGSMEEAKRVIEKDGILVDGVRLPGVIWRPAHTEAMLAINTEVRGAIRTGLLKGKSLTEAITDGLKRIDNPELKRIYQEAEAGDIYILPRVVEERINDWNRIESNARLSRVGAAFTDVNNMYRGFWLATGGFIKNNIVGDITLSFFAGTSPRSLVQALLPKYRALVDDIYELKFGIVSEASTLLDSYTTKATDSVWNNAMNLVRQEGLIPALGAEAKAWGRSITDFVMQPKQIPSKLVTGVIGAGKAIPKIPGKVVEATTVAGRAIHKFGAETDETFRAAAAIQAAKNVTAEEKLRDVVRLNELGISGHLLDELVTKTQRQLGVVRANPELLDSVIKHVNYFFADYHGLPPWQRIMVRRVMPFWTWTKHVSTLAWKFPRDHPVRAMLYSHITGVAADLTDQEELPRMYRGTVPADPAFPGQRIRGSGMDVFGGSILMGIAAGEGPPNVAISPGIDTVLFLLSMSLDNNQWDASNVMESYGRKYRLDTVQGNIVVDETDATQPPIPEYLARTISQTGVVAEFARNWLADKSDSDIKTLVEQIVGRPATLGRDTSAGYVPPQHPQRRLLAYFGIPLTHDLPENWRAAKEALEQRLISKRDFLIEQRLRQGLTEEPAMFER